MPKVAVLGYYGYGNFGDALMLEGLRELFKGWEVTVLAATSESEYQVFDYDIVNKCDLFVLGGGELIFNDRLFFYTPLVRYTSIPAFAFRMLNFDSWVKHIKIPKIVLGCGVNVDDASQLEPNVIRELALFDYIGLRDVESVNILNSFSQLRGKVELFNDLAFQLKINSFAKRSKDLAVVAPTNRSYLNTVVDSKKWLTEQLQPYNSVIFLPFGSKDNNDYQTCLELAGCIPSYVMLQRNELSFDLAVELYSKCAMSFPYRLHGLILSYLTNTPYQFYPYHRKLSRMHQTLTASPQTIQHQQTEQFKQVLEALHC